MIPLWSFAATSTTVATSGLSSNPAAVNIVTGTGALQSFFDKQLGIKNNHGFRVGGLLLAEANDLFSGGIPDADRVTTNGLFLFSASVDTEKANGWKGGLFDIEVLQFNGQDTNGQAGSVQGYNSLPGPSPLNRFELYQLWFRQALFDDKLIIRIGKTIPTDDFQNVIKPIPLDDDNLNIIATSELIYLPLFVNTSMLGVIPGYYNSSYGITINITPIKQWYASLGVYDGNLAQGVQTGLTGPNINGNYFDIGETGLAWTLGSKKLPGNVAVGLWHQAGTIQSSRLIESGASGYYLFGAQRLWYASSTGDNSGITSFYQFGTNSSHVLPMTKYVGAGLTGYGLIPNRLHDIMGVGGAYSWLNKTSFRRHSEFMVQAYYQALIIKAFYVEPVLSYIPAPGAMPNLNAAWAGTVRFIALF